MKERCLNLRAWESRRLLNLAAGETAVLVRPVNGMVMESKRPGEIDMMLSNGDAYVGSAAELCPFGRPGDTLIGREAWAQVHPLQACEGRRSKPGTAGIPGPPGVTYRVVYKADGDYPRLYHRSGYPYRQLEPNVSPEDLCGDKWKPWWTGPQHMPRAYAWHRLTVVSVEVARCCGTALHDLLHTLDVPNEHRFLIRKEWPEKRFPWATSHAWVLTVRKPLTRATPQRKDEAMSEVKVTRADREAAWVALRFGDDDTGAGDHVIDGAAKCWLAGEDDDYGAFEHEQRAAEAIARARAEGAAAALADPKLVLDAADKLLRERGWSYAAGICGEEARRG